MSQGRAMTGGRGPSKTALVYALGILVSASLLFMVQPMVARMLLPRLGGTAAVWTTCQLFFQLLLLGGYLYAHILAKRLSTRVQIGLHLSLVAAAALFLPIAIRAGAPTLEQSPIGWLLITLAGAVGLPFFVLSTTSPLLQSWFSRTKDPLAPNPYPLYAASNLGSMASLLGYPFLIEPLLSLRGQSLLWTALFALFALALIACILTLRAHGGLNSHAPDAHSSDLDPAAQPAPSNKMIFRWILLAALPSSLMLGVTTHITTDVAPMPLLWIAPLALYLMSFIIVFGRWRASQQEMVTWVSWSLLLPALILLVINPINQSTVMLLLYLAAFMALALVFHGQLALERPAAKHLTLFFLCMSIGGALGGLFNGLFAPLVFDRFLELHIALAAASLMLLRPVAALCEHEAQRQRCFIALALSLSLAVNLCINEAGAPLLIACIVASSALLARLLSMATAYVWPTLLVTLAAAQIGLWQLGDVVATERSFFSAHKVMHYPDEQLIALMHGNTNHGMQSTDPARRQQASSYHHPLGPVGQALRALPVPAQARFAIIGLGAGALATYCQGQVRCDLFEIDPVVVEIAREHFTYLEGCGPRCSVEVGDGRQLLEAKPDQTYDIIFLDAYNSDSVPIHLLTREALEIYKRKLKPGGALLFHISNRHFDLRSPIAPLARSLHMTAVYQIFMPTRAQMDQGMMLTQWAVLAPEESTMAALLRDRRWTQLEALPTDPIWTDDFSNIFPTLGNTRPAPRSAEAP